MHAFHRIPVANLHSVNIQPPVGIWMSFLNGMSLISLTNFHPQQLAWTSYQLGSFVWAPLFSISIASPFNRSIATSTRSFASGRAPPSNLCPRLLRLLSILTTAPFPLPHFSAEPWSVYYCQIVSLSRYSHTSCFSHLRQYSDQYAFCPTVSTCCSYSHSPTSFPTIHSCGITVLSISAKRLILSAMPPCLVKWLRWTSLMLSTTGWWSFLWTQTLATWWYTTSELLDISDSCRYVEYLSESLTGCSLQP